MKQVKLIQEVKISDSIVVKVYEKHAIGFGRYGQKVNFRDCFGVLFVNSVERCRVSAPYGKACQDQYLVDMTAIAEMF